MEFLKFKLCDLKFMQGLWGPGPQGHCRGVPKRKRERERNKQKERERKEKVRERGRDRDERWRGQKKEK